MFVDGFHEQALDLRQGEDFFHEGIELGFAQHLCQWGYAFNGCTSGDQPVRPLPAVTFFIVGGTVFKLLLFVPELGKLTLTGGDLGFQFGDGFLLGPGT